MKLTIMLTSLLIVASPVFAEEVVVHSPQKQSAYGVRVATRIFENCASRFVERVFRGQKVKYNTRLNIDKRVADEAARVDYMVVTLQALSKHDRSLLATGSCTATHLGLVRDLSVFTAPAAKLAGLTPKDVQLAMVSR